MSSESIAIPKRKCGGGGGGVAGEVESSSISSDSSSASSSPSSFEMTMPVRTAGKGKQRAVEVDVERTYLFARRPSLLGSELAQSEYTVFNLSHSEAAVPRLVTCVKSSQGFVWNQELFLPSYADHDSHDLEHRPDPVEDIILTDEEAAALMPQ